MRRIYKFTSEELITIVNDNGFIPLKEDPKVILVRENSEFFPVDVNNAGYYDLMRVPGIGHISATRIIKLKNKNVRIYKNEQLKAVGVVLKRAIPFLKIGEKKQLTMENFQEQNGGL